MNNKSTHPQNIVTPSPPSHSRFGEPGPRSPAGCYNRPQVKDPLVGPLAAIASGILVSRFVPFHSSELFAAIGAFLLLSMVALWRDSDR